MVKFYVLKDETFEVDTKLSQFLRIFIKIYVQLELQVYSLLLNKNS